MAIERTPSVGEVVGGAAHAVLVERFDLPPAVVEAAAHADRVAPLDERRRALVREVVHVARRDVAAPDQEDVGHPLVGDDPGRLTAPFEHGVEAERRAVDEQADVGEIGAEGVDRGDARPATAAPGVVDAFLKRIRWVCWSSSIASTNVPPMSTEIW